MLPHLCLGTVQFGQPYGITNHIGLVPEREVNRILLTASASGIQFLDTAQAYGMSEEILGRCWPPGAPRRLISKLPSGLPKDKWDDCFYQSLDLLQASKLDSFLLHSASDLLSDQGDDLLIWLESLRERNLVGRIGVSIYDTAELQKLPLERLQIVQLPLSVYDQHFINDGTISTLHSLGIAIHVRSVFLQGLVLQAPQYWPDHLSPAFKHHHTKWIDHITALGLSPLKAALSYVTSCKYIEAVLVGVLSQRELLEVIQVWSHLDCSSTYSFESWAWDISQDLDPRLWPKRSC